MKDKIAKDDKKLIKMMEKSKQRKLAEIRSKVQDISEHDPERLRELLKSVKSRCKMWDLKEKKRSLKAWRSEDRIETAERVMPILSLSLMGLSGLIGVALSGALTKIGRVICLSIFEVSAIAALGSVGLVMVTSFLDGGPRNVVLDKLADSAEKKARNLDKWSENIEGMIEKE